MSQLKTTDISPLNVILVIAALALSIADMFFISDVFTSLKIFNAALASVVAFVLSIIGFFLAFRWGQLNGKFLAERPINKRSVGAFLGWATIGILYLVFRIIKVISVPGVNILAEIAIMVILSVLYITAGVLVMHSVAELLNSDAGDCRRAKKAYKAAHLQLIKQEAAINTLCNVLAKYNEYYTDLKGCQSQIYQQILDSEKGAMASLEAPIIAAGAPNSAAKQVMENVLAPRKETLAKLKSKK